MKKVLIYGAGQLGGMVAYILSYQDDIEIVGFIDDDQTQMGCEYNGIPVLGSASMLSNLRKEGINGAIVSIGSNKIRSQIADQLVKYGKGGRGRSHYEPGNYTVRMSTNARPQAVVHELGHAFEDLNPTVHDRAVAFLEKRTQDESASWLGDSFDRREIGKRDRFIDPYMGKIYRKRSGEIYATEIVSMGMELLYSDAVHFATRDPEYFEFMVSLLRGIW